SGGPTNVTLREAGTSGSSAGSGGSGGAATGSGGSGGAATGSGGSVGDTDASDDTSTGGSMIESGAGGRTSGGATRDGGCIIPVTFEDYLNACPRDDVISCPLAFATPLPNPLPMLP